MKLVFAPLFGITTAKFRVIYSRHFGGFTAVLAPFISTTCGNPPSLSHYRDILPENNPGNPPLIPQLIGKDAKPFAEAANRIHECFGYEEVNWNIGCPSNTVTRGKRGAGLLPCPDVIDAFLNDVCPHIKCKLSIKMRIGMFESDEYLKLVPVLNSYPISEITVHPRTGIQMYGGHADVEKFADIFSLLKHPVMYNGDIRTVEDARKILLRFPGVSGLMTGRGAISNPLLPEMVQTGSTFVFEDFINRLKRFHDDLFAAYQSHVRPDGIHSLGRMKELWRHWAENFANKEEILNIILQAKNIRDYPRAAQTAFEKAVKTKIIR